MSSGGGYCDCGDAEAWRAHVFCDLHLKGSQKVTLIIIICLSIKIIQFKDNLYLFSFLL